ncbi:MAG: UDP-N-acetylmuramate dehydrogenase [Propionibacteriaceae bacterium]|nr:UDP-N-acetylmuramate dehydrogenase [Propionibacteriaceae bacterium]
MTEPQACDVSFVSHSGEATDDSDSIRLAEHTTFRVGGPAGRFVRATSQDELIGVVSEADSRGEPVLVLGGGSNLLVPDAGFDGTVVQVANRGITAEVSSCGGAMVRVQAGENWDEFAGFAVGQQWVGVESLAGIPGSVGATPIQNVGAYGSDVSATISAVRTFDRQEGRVRTFPAVDCGFGYRSSLFKRMPGRYCILDVAFQFRLGSLSAPVAYPELARALGVEVGDRADTAEVRDAVLRIRRSKGMVLDEADHDTWSGGSFFTNPLLTSQQAAALPPEAPRFATGEFTKTSAAWLIQHAGFAKGYGNHLAALSTKHVLAVTNRGEAGADDLVALAREVRDGVEARYGIRLEPEVNILGVTL